MTADSDLSRLFAAERAVRAPAHLAERGLVRLLTDLATGAAPLPVAASTSKLGVSAISKWILTGFVVGVLGSGAAAKLWAPAATEPVVRAVAAPANTRVAAASGNKPATTAVPSAPTSEPHVEQPAAARPNKAWPPHPEPSAGQATFDAELRLINLAKGELDAGRPHLAKVWLDEHAAKFPSGVFATDREALRVLAGCAERQNPALSGQFAAQHPRSPMPQRLARACGAPVEATLPNETTPLGEPTAR